MLARPIVRSITGRGDPPTLYTGTIGTGAAAITYTTTLPGVTVFIVEAINAEVIPMAEGLHVNAVLENEYVLTGFSDLPLGYLKRAPGPDVFYWSESGSPVIPTTGYHWEMIPLTPDSNGWRVRKYTDGVVVLEIASPTQTDDPADAVDWVKTIGEASGTLVVVKLLINVAAFVKIFNNMNSFVYAYCPGSGDGTFVAGGSVILE